MNRYWSRNFQGPFSKKNYLILGYLITGFDCMFKNFRGFESFWKNCQRIKIIGQLKPFGEKFDFHSKMAELYIIFLVNYRSDFNSSKTNLILDSLRRASRSDHFSETFIQSWAIERFLIPSALPQKPVLTTDRFCTV